MPEVNQPCRGGLSTTTVTTIVQTGGDWSTGLFSAFSDKTVCACGLFLLPCLECHLTRIYGECPCFPLLPGSLLALRVGIRERHKIQGTMCEDWLAVYCCWPFAVCQMARELKRRITTLVYHETPSV
ncbi:PLAC8-like protein 1 [Ascaphus truei]|uniref:PLAC8-like protein 1 n=1 Tax=Ascaphus truei TaxID=8439 RepID=UPI003F5A6A23